jgi:hypothetical protein
MRVGNTGIVFQHFLRKRSLEESSSGAAGKKQGAGTY